MSNRIKLLPRQSVDMLNLPNAKFCIRIVGTFRSAFEESFNIGWLGAKEVVGEFLELTVFHGCSVDVEVKSVI